MIAGELSGYQLRSLPQWLDLPVGVNIDDYAVNIGLALKKISIRGLASRVSMNVVPEMYKPKPLPVVGILSWVAVIIALIMVIMMTISTTRAVAETASLQTELENLEQRIGIAKGTAASLVKLRSELDEGSAELAIFKQPVDKAAEQRANVNEKLAKVTSLKPGNVQITAINYGGTKIGVGGNAPDMELVLNYVSALRDSGRFSKVVIQQLAEVKFNEWKFTLQLD
jgi:Tfp pilus assembly protein PilN